MSLPSFMIFIDMAGSATVLIIAALAFWFALRWSRQKPDDLFVHYIFLLTLAIVFFAFSRSVGHLVKQSLILSGNARGWELLSPYSGSVNTVSFILVFAFSLFFRRFQKIHYEIEAYRNNLEELVRLRTSELQLANDSLAREQERLAVTLGSIAEGVIATDLEGRVVLMNPVAEELTGWLSPEATGKKMEEIVSIVCQESDTPCPDAVKRVLSVPADNNPREKKILVAKSGRRVKIEESSAPIFDANHEIIGVVMVIRDVTEREKALASLFRLEKLESVGILAGGIAHDFRNLLSAINGSLELAFINLMSGEDATSLLKDARKATLRARVITEQLLTVSKGGDPIKKSTTIIDNIRDSARFMLYGTAVHCTFNIPDDLWHCDVDAGQLSQVIQNLVINARQAMSHKGEMVITCMNIPEGKDVTIMGSHVRIEISDTGTGIPPEQIQKIFDPYYTTKSEGSGLGLALSISIIRKHGGILDVRSTVGEGTTFTILLPVSMEQVYPPVNEVSTMPSRNFSGSVLIMDDEELILRVSEKMLQSLGHRVLSAKNGEEAIALYREHKDAGDPFCALILDVNVSGGMGGEVAATAILEMDPAARIILSSGYFKENEDPKDHTPGISGIITKPYLMDELKQALIGLM